MDLNLFLISSESLRPQSNITGLILVSLIQNYHRNVFNSDFNPKLLFKLTTTTTKDSNLLIWIQSMTDFVTWTQMMISLIQIEPKIMIVIQNKYCNIMNHSCLSLFHLQMNLWIFGSDCGRINVSVLLVCLCACHTCSSRLCRTDNPLCRFPKLWIWTQSGSALRLWLDLSKIYGGPRRTNFSFQT